MSSILIAYGNWLFRERNRVFPVVMLVLFASFRPRLAGGSLSSDLWLDLVGLGISASGQLLRALVVGLAYIKRGGVDKKVHADTLVTEGLFAHARNPLYVGNLLILAGLFVIHNHPLVYVLGGAFFGLAYIAVVRAEETYLGSKFGVAFTAYCARVPRWLPRFGGLTQTVTGMRFNWRRVVSKEMESCIVWVMTALLLLAYEAATSSAGMGATRQTTLLSAGAVCVAIFLSVGMVKRRGGLREPVA
ncbi:MAG: isoprenylcysteine carboxylmethyltransferase family protein [Gammaproteobacteria bacterium]|nr:isoprenylcysteine carboxylmethyltransferase family protein [Gammaproteobacteria bacterium]